MSVVAPKQAGRLPLQSRFQSWSVSSFEFRVSSRRAHHNSKLETRNSKLPCAWFSRARRPCHSQLLPLLKV